MRRRGRRRRLARRRAGDASFIRRSGCTTRGGNPLTEAGIEVGAARDLFAALGDDLGQGRWSMRLQYKPLIRFIWLGAILIALGGLRRGARPTLSPARHGACRRERVRARPRDEVPAAIPRAGDRIRGAGRLLLRRSAARPGSDPVAAHRQARAGFLAGIARRPGVESAERRISRAGPGC